MAGGGAAMRTERRPSITQLMRSTSVSKRSLQISDDMRAAMRRSIRRGTDWAVVFRRMRPSQQQSAIAQAFQTRKHNTTDVAVAALEMLIMLVSALQLGLTYKTAFWRENRACVERDDCTVDVSDGSFQLADCVRLVLLVLVLARAWVRIRFILKARRSGKRRSDKDDWRGKMVLEVLSMFVFPFPCIESLVGRHRSEVLLLLTLSVGVRPIFWRQLTYLPYPIRQQEKVASFSDNLEFSYRSFVFKKVMDDNPLLKIQTIVVLLMLFGSYLVHVVETIDAACSWPPSTVNQPVTSSRAICTELSVPDALWLLATTMVPIGFGDVVPKTHAGRTLVVLSAVVAVSLNAMFFSTIMRKFSFSSMEARVHAFLFRMDLYGKKDMSAVLAVQATFRFHKSYKRSLIWHQQPSSSVLYRPLSARLPNEVKKKLYTSRFQASLKGIMKYDTDGDPINAFVKHIEVITAALGTAFRDITSLKKIASQRSIARPKQLLRPAFLAAAAFATAHDSAVDPSTSEATPMLKRRSGGSALVSPSEGLAQTMSLPSRVEEPPLVPPKTSPAKPATTTMSGFNGSSHVGGVPAAWGEEMLRKCEETLATLRRIKQDAKAIL